LGGKGGGGLVVVRDAVNGVVTWGYGCMCIHIHTHTHMYVTHVYIHIFIHLSLYIYRSTHLHQHTLAREHKLRSHVRVGRVARVDRHGLPPPSCDVTGVGWIRQGGDGEEIER
jgi:hypothetical protein